MRPSPMRAQIVLPFLPRNPVLRALTLIGVIALAAALVAIGFVVAASAIAVAAVALAVRRWRLGRAARNAEPAVIEGEFTVVHQPERPRAELPHSDWVRPNCAAQKPDGGSAGGASLLLHAYNTDRRQLP